jgi:hypothetical protein
VQHGRDAAVLAWTRRASRCAIYNIAIIVAALILQFENLDHSQPLNRAAVDAQVRDTYFVSCLLLVIGANAGLLCLGTVGALLRVPLSAYCSRSLPKYSVRNLAACRKTAYLLTYASSALMLNGVFGLVVSMAADVTVSPAQRAPIRCA